jgi:hypothetical protein
MLPSIRRLPGIESYECGSSRTKAATISLIITKGTLDACEADHNADTAARAPLQPIYQMQDRTRA